MASEAIDKVDLHPLRILAAEKGDDKLLRAVMVFSSKMRALEEMSSESKDKMLAGIRILRKLMELKNQREARWKATLSDEEIHDIFGDNSYFPMSGLADERTIEQLSRHVLGNAVGII